MSSQPVRKARWTYAEFVRLPDDGNRYEVIARELYMTPAPRPIHQRAVGELAFRLVGFVRQHGLGWVLPGPVDVLFAEGDYLTPDLVFIRRDRAGLISGRGSEGVPDLVAAVLSDSTAARDRGIKRERYAPFGVPENWVIDPLQRQNEAFRMLIDPNHPTIAADTLVWQPVPGGPTLEISVSGVVRGFE